MLLFKYVQTAEKMKKDKAANAQKFSLKNRRGDSQGAPLEAVGGFKRGDRNPPFVVFGSFLP